MSVTQQSTVTTHTATGTTNVFAYGFRILAAADLVVEVNGSQLTLGVDYTVAGVGLKNGGSVTLLGGAPTAGVVVRLRRSTRLERATDYQSGGDFLSAVVNADFDRAMMALQDLFYGSSGPGSSLRAPAGEALGELPAAPQRAGMQLLFDAQGQPYLAAPVGGSAADVLLQFAGKTAANQGAGLSGFAPQLNYVAGTLGKSLSQREWLVTDYPWLAKFDGSTDDTAAINACLAALYAAGGGTMLMPKGTAMVSSVAFNWAALCCINIRGAGKRATKLKKIPGTATPVLNLSTSAGILETYCTLSDFSIEGNAYACNGVQTQRFARFNVKNLDIRKCNTALVGNGLLVGAIKSCTIQDNINGIGLDRDDGGTVYSNAISVEHTQIAYCTGFGVVLTRGSGLYLYNCDIEKCGTAGVAGSGGVMVRSTCGAEYGMSVISLEKVWFEGNFGTGLIVEDGAPARLSLDTGHIIAQEAGQLALNVRGGYFLAMNFQSPSPGDQWTINASASTLINCQVTTINDTSARKTHLNTGGELGVDSNGGFSQDVLISMAKALRFAANNTAPSMAVYPDFASTLLKLSAGPGGTIYCENSLAIGDGTWNGQHPILGGYHLWIDTSGRLRIKNGAPTSAADGTVVGAQS